MTDAPSQCCPAEGFLEDLDRSGRIPLVENTDWLDVKASVQGDEDAYERLVRRYEKQITGLLWRFTRDPVQCEELVQQVFVRFSA
jgi:hypothetical protein